MSTVQRVAQVFGWVFLLVGIVGLVQVHTMEIGMLMGLFPVNLLHNVVHVLFGLWGLAAARSFSGAKMYGQIGGAIYLLLAVLGFVIADPMGPMGLVPLGGNDVWLHVVLGVVLAYFGFTAKEGGAGMAAA